MCIPYSRTANLKRYLQNPEDYNALNYSAAIGPRVAASSFTGLEELPFPLSFHLINIFLPYRDHFCFSMDIAYFLRCLSLPSSHPESIHPCLLNACYLAACVLSRGRLSSFEPYFVNKTRHFLEQSLMFADRIPHFLLASMILGSYFRKLRRLEEAFAVISSAGHLATACGLLHESHTGLDSSESLLPPPNTEREAAERMELARSIYITDQSLVVVSGYTMSFAGNDYWGSPSELLRLQQQQQESNTIEGREHSGLWPSDEFLKVSVLKFFERVKAFALLFCESGTRAYETTYLALSQQLSSILAAIPPLPNPQDLQPSELSKAFGLGAVVAHSTLNGSGLILHSLRAGIDPEARRQMLRCMRGVVETVRKLQELRNIQKSGAQASLMSMFHVMNAIRIVTQELQKSEVRRAANSSTHYFQSLEVLLDHLEDGSLIYPEWANTHAVLKEPLTTALQSLEI
ncbi:hypothetical protein DL93DRAFT_1087003 [Clavulina sp. PMI_390]|nr:hypothetical protein DL93DRAFT_1087003 [Clavulina sp. PMI_390]